MKEIVLSIPWVLYSSRKFGGLQHVNIRELGGLCEVFRRGAEFSLFPRRTVCGTDSAVSLGAAAKGRSPSFNLNRVLRSALGHMVVGRKPSSHFKVATADNAADDPTRDRELRAPVAAPAWLEPLLQPEAPIPYSRSMFVKWRGGACREVYAGSGMLSDSLSRRGCWVEPPMECFPKPKTYIAEADLDRLDVRCGLLEEIRAGFVRYIHFGAPCKSWGPANRLNGGTRTRSQPDGTPPILPREALGNRQA